MGSVASTNPGLADLFQNLASVSSPLASQLSSPAMQSALEKAPAGDVVQLSNEVMQLQKVGTLFADPNQTSSSNDPSSILAALFPSSSNATGSLSSFPIDPSAPSGTSATSTSSQAALSVRSGPDVVRNPSHEHVQLPVQCSRLTSTSLT
jgi:hypothetical protein